MNNVQHEIERLTNAHRKLEIFDPILSEYENMPINRYFRIWDCGNLTYIWNINGSR